jgi:phosphatidylglycerol:prolipoprotein diacylglycerol transferase
MGPLLIGFLLAAHLAKFLANRSGLDGELFINIALISLVTGVLGSRLSHILENTSEFFNPNRSAWANFLDMLNLRSGGLTYYGGFILSAPCLIAYFLHKKIPLRLAIDILAPCLMIGLGIGRVGCLLNGCCYGALGAGVT